MKPLFRFHKGYFFLTLLLFVVELLIALYVRDKFVRPYLGDFLVVLLLYCFFKSFLNLSVLKTAALVLLIACCVEAFQYINLVARLGLTSTGVGGTVLGTSFDWSDVLAYILGIAAVVAVEKRRVQTVTNETGFNNFISNR